MKDKEITTSIKKEIERKWKSRVADSVRSIRGLGSPYYVLSMFPYPSGNLHMGHVRVYTISDAIAHFHRLSGKNVIHPMGWDAFGLPAENAAIERNIPPSVWTKKNIEVMKMQLNELGCIFDWDSEVNTSDPSYYKWTQLLFLELFKYKLAYKREALVNWDPVDQTVLADEQIDDNGLSWRSGALVEKKVLSQWFIKTTKFAKDLYDGLNTKYLEDWKDIIRIQRHWIGECNGYAIDFTLLSKDKKFEVMTVWTESPEILTCAEFIALSSSHLLNRRELYKFENQSYKQLVLEAINPFNDKRLSIFVTDNFSYPEGADTYLGCPSVNINDDHFLSLTGNNFKINDDFKNLSNAEILQLREEVCNFLKKNSLGGYSVSSKLKDWLISRQRYWGTPIPIVFCDNCGNVPVPEEELPLSFPEINVKGKVNTMQELDRLGWINTTCPKCGQAAKRDTDTMDTFVDSSWYFLRYLDAKNKMEPFNSNAVSKKFPVDLYIGGKEHAVLHLYYARFMTHFLYSIGKVKVKEPFIRLLVQGMVMGKTFKEMDTGRYLPASEVEIVDEKKGIAVTRKDNKKVKMFWEKMSKSKYNGVDPATLFNEYGCDTTRLLILSDVTPRSPRNWSSATFSGVLNWQKRVWCTVQEFIEHRRQADGNKIIDPTTLKKFSEYESNLRNIRNGAITYLTHCFSHAYNLSSAISKLHVVTKALRQKYPPEFISQSAEYEKSLVNLIIMLAPMAPHFSSELWDGVQNAPIRISEADVSINWNKSVFHQKWPVVDEDYNLRLVCKINGNEMGDIYLPRNELNQLTEATAMEHIFNNSKIGLKVKKQFISKTIFDVYPNCFATFNFIMDYNIRD